MGLGFLKTNQQSPSSKREGLQALGPWHPRGKPPPWVHPPRSGGFVFCKLHPLLHPPRASPPEAAASRGCILREGSTPWVLTPAGRVQALPHPSHPPPL